MTRRPRVDVQIAPGAPADLTAAGLRALARHTLAREGVADAPAVSLVIVDDAAIRALHARFLGVDAPTDVLTFAEDDGGAFPTGERDRLLGEVVVSYETAAAQAPDYGHTPGDEVRFLVVHGLLHLLGHDDASEAERAAMLARQAAILADFRRQAAGG